ncbi:MAG: AmmeMemoRadiSam system protein A [Clostridia bacterium]|nr:AmmeMemoRadiSam system protein A [Clostridia bacterium]
MLQMVAICPHPPIIIPEVGKGEEKKAESTVKAMKQIAQAIKNLDPDLLVFITPHGPVFKDAITISKPRTLKGSFHRFGTSVSLERSFAADFSAKLINEARGLKAMVAELTDADGYGYGISLELDHGILVPLYYLDKEGIDAPIIPINMGLLPYADLYEFGICLRKVIDNTEQKVVVVVSADLSHRLTKDAPAGFDPQGKVFDEIIVQAITDGDTKRVLTIDEKIVAKAGECGLRPIIMGLGVLDGNEISSQVYSYEGPFGVGYMVAALTPGREMQSRRILEEIRQGEKERIQHIRNQESWPVKWARENLESYIKTGKLLNLPDKIPPEFAGRKGVFVSIKKDGQLRGCIGTISATKKNIVEEIQSNVLKAAFEDPRFEPIEEEELNNLTYSVDILEKPEKINGLEELDPEIYGVIVRKGWKQGLLLPMLDGIDTPEEQVAIAKQKAGIGPGEKVELERFRVTRYL